MKDGKEFGFIDYLTTETFLKVAYDVIFLGFPNETILFDSGNNSLNEVIYESKTNIIKILSNLVSVIRPHLHMNKLETTAFGKILASCTHSFLESLSELGSNRENESLLENEKMRGCVTIMLTTVAQLVYIKEFHEEFKALGFRLLTDIGFPFLRTMKGEKMEMMDNPNEFVKLALDVCDRQKYSQLKSQAAKFIETIGDKISGIFVSMANLIIDILDYAVTKDPNIDQYAILKDHYPQSKFFTYCSDEELIDCSLLTLTMISYALPKNLDLKNRFTETIERITQPIMQRNSLLLNCRLTIMLGYYIDILYKEDNGTFLNVIKMFIDSLNTSEDNLALAHQSADTLNTIINDNDIIPRIEPIIGDLLRSIAPCILVVKIPDFFDFLSEVFKYYKKHISEEDFTLVLKCICQRIDKDVQEAKGDAQQENPFQNNDSSYQASESHAVSTTMAVQKCWSIINEILKNDVYISKFLPQLQDELKYLFGLLSDSRRIEFDDDILKSMNIIISKSGQVSDVMKVLFPYLKNTFEKHKFVYSELFEVIKAY